MRIGILGAGFIGATLTTRLSQAGHDVTVANSRGPETIDPTILAFGARALSAAEVTDGVEVLITSIPFNRMPGLASLVGRLPGDVPVVDTSNYYPHRDGPIPAIDDGEPESVWVSEQLGRPVAKAWNAIPAESFAGKASTPGTPGRIAIPVAADRARDRAVAMQLVEETGFDALDAGTLEESWRQHPGSPAYCTDLALEDLRAALASAVKERVPRRRDLVTAVVAERISGDGGRGDTFGEWLVQLNRAVY